MILNNEGLKDRAAWEAAGYALPGFDREAVREKTRRRHSHLPDGSISERAISSVPFRRMFCRNF